MALIERENLLSLLRNGFAGLDSGQGHCFFILGEAGIGKSALVKTFLNEVEGKSIQYTGACDSLFTPRPLAPLHDIALQVKEDWAQKISSGSSTAELFTECARQFTNKEKPVLLLFEDIHWADEATIDFIKFFARRIPHTNCMFLLTLRDTELNYQHLLRNLLSDINPSNFTRVHLGPLSREAVHKMAIQKGYDPENLYHIAGGNPFYLNEILASYSPGIPENIKDSILAVYDRQAEGTKNAWEIFSVIAEGLEIDRFIKIKTSWDTAIDHCFALSILLVENGKVIFKHELYRRTIEESLSLFKRIAINKKLLDYFLESFEKEGEIERIVHYAKNANDNDTVVKYAPLAAMKAAAAGAHLQSAKLYLIAIEFAEGLGKRELVKLYESYAYECYLTNQMKDAIIYQSKALDIWEQLNETENAGNGMRILSRLWWFDGNRQEAEKYAEQAISVLESQPASKAKAMAYSNLSQLKMLSEEFDAAIEWGKKALQMAKKINDQEIYCHALNNIGSAEWKKDWSHETGKNILLQSLDIALKNSFHEQAARAYSNIAINCLTAKEYDEAGDFLEKGIDYCEERNLDASKNFKLYLKGRMLLETGHWNEAASIATNLLANTRQLGTVRIGALTLQSCIKVRRGEPDALVCLQDARSLAFNSEEYQRMMPVILTMLEYEWLSGKELITPDELQHCIDLVQKIDNIFVNSEFAFWLQKARDQEVSLPALFEPYLFLKSGEIKKAAAYWEKLDCPYEQALALFEGKEDDKKKALAIFQKLDASPVYEKAKTRDACIGH